MVAPPEDRSRCYLDFIQGGAQCGNIVVLNGDGSGNHVGRDDTGRSKNELRLLVRLVDFERHEARF